MKARKPWLMALFAVLTLCLLALPALAAEKTETIDHWKADSPAMQSIVEFVTASVDEDSEGYIPPEDRIAVFDMDGTLYGERFPTYFNDWLFIQRALYDDDYDAPEELKAFAQAWEDKVLRGVPIEDFDAKERELGPKLYEGLTYEEYADVVRKFKAMDVRGFTGMTYGDAYFQPMVSLVKYLCEHDYTVYIVSATYRDAVRVMTEGVLDDYIPFDRVIGTDLLYVASGDADKNSMFYELQPKDELVIAGELFIKNQKTNKATVIQQEIGRKPVLAFGNSTGDFSMATYTLSNETYGGRAYMLLCDDTERDYGDPEVAAAFKKKCDDNGFYTVSEKDEFETLYPDGAHVTNGYKLEQVVILSRHNIRAPLSNSGSAVGELTPHTWTKWTAPESELTLKGGISETLMGQYFRKWLENEGLAPENWVPEEDQIRFYANARQRTVATARYFASGLLPLANVEIEYKDGKLGTVDPVFKPLYTFISESYRNAVQEELQERFNLWKNGKERKALAEKLDLLADVIDYEDSPGYASGNYGPWTADDIEVVLEEGKETSVNGSIKTAMAAGDALMLQYYELSDAKAAAFGKSLSQEDWEKIADITTTYQSLRYGSQLSAVNTAHPMLQELLSEMQNPERKLAFLCGHDSNVASVLTALGVTDYSLPNTLEKKTPIGCKLIFERWSGEDGEEFARVRLVYQSTEQLRSLAPLSLEAPPMSYTVQLPGLQMDAGGFYRLEDVYDCFQDAIDAYDALAATYGDDDEISKNDTGNKNDTGSKDDTGSKSDTGSKNDTTEKDDTADATESNALQILADSAVDTDAQSLGLKSVGNARELGGYLTEDGRTVKNGVFLRSASLGNASYRDIQRLLKVYNLSVIADLRSTLEIERAPDPDINGVRNIQLGIMDEEALAAKQKSLSAEQLKELDENDPLYPQKLALLTGVVSDQFYIELLSGEPGKAGFRQLFQELLDLPEGKSLLFHCSQGKDRTGCAAMLILSALGVDEDTIMEDYLLTNAFNADKIESERQMLLEQGVKEAELDDYLMVMDQVNAQTMLNALDWLKESYGSVEGYITEELGISEKQLETLRDMYLDGEAEYEAAA